MASRPTKNMTLRLDESLAENVEAIAAVDGSSMSDVIREALAEHVQRRREDPEFQERLRRNMRRHNELLNMLADG